MKDASEEKAISEERRSEKDAEKEEEPEDESGELSENAQKILDDHLGNGTAAAKNAIEDLCQYHRSRIADGISEARQELKDHEAALHELNKEGEDDASGNADEDDAQHHDDEWVESE